MRCARAPRQPLVRERAARPARARRGPAPSTARRAGPTSRPARPAARSPRRTPAGAPRAGRGGRTPRGRRRPTCHSSRNETGPRITGPVSIPSSSIASACSSNGFVEESEKLRLGPELRDDVVVVGVEPLRHLHRRHVDPLLLAPARHGEVGVDAHPLARCSKRSGTAPTRAIVSRTWS